MAGRLVEALDLSFARRAGGPLPGEHRAPGVGAGTELAALRAYQPGDDVRRLDASATRAHRASRTCGSTCRSGW